eukprot:TRINITY_DN3803_c0_g1_i1.p1 TRINITY_DN3803_c0_g1~~TRINITY_DN3803_c0_g1_i1.p1  ORF type:complete len:372 (+),score=77.38 TRINITY_DN3803_c0_g1_i1:81-1118(+)
MSVVKLVLNEVVRRFPLTGDLTISKLHNYVSQYFPSLVNFRMNYIDEENDTISLADDSDLREALRVAKNFKNGILRIQLVATNPPHASQPTSSENQLKDQFLQTIRQLKTSIPLLNAINEEAIASQIFNSQNSQMPIVLGPYTQTLNLDPICLTQTMNQQLPQIISTVLSQMGPLLGTMMMAPSSNTPFCIPSPAQAQSVGCNPPTFFAPTQASANPFTAPLNPSQSQSQSPQTSFTQTLNAVPTNQEIEAATPILPPISSEPLSGISTTVPDSLNIQPPEPIQTQETPSLTPFEAQFFEERPFQYEEELKVLEGMGFSSRGQLIWRLKKFKGNLAAVVDDLLSE